MDKRWLLVPLFLILLLAVFAWQAPALLRALPSRYVARLPEPVQALGVREHVEALPTAGLRNDVSHLLVAATTPAAAPATRQQVAAPATPTPPPTSSAAHMAAVAASATPTAAVTATAIPSPTATPFPLPAQVRLQGVQHRFQDWNNCGPATLTMSLTYFDIYHTQKDTAAVLKPDPEDRNVSPEEMAAYVNDETEIAALSRVNGNLELLRHLMAEGFPVIVEVGIDPPGDFAWMEWYGHYLLPVAYDDELETFWVYDSWFGTSDVPQENADDAGREISYQELDQRWRQFNRSFIVLYPPAEQQKVSAIIGSAMDDGAMWEASLAHVQAELQTEPENAYLWFNLGTVFNALGEYERAATAFDKARDIGLPWRMLWYQFGPYEAYYETGRYEEVVLLADVTLQDRPYFEEAFYYKGLAQIALGDRSEGRKNLQRAADFNPNFAPAVEALARIDP